MLVYFNKDNIVIASHPDNQAVDPTVYGGDIRVVPLPDQLLRPGSPLPPVNRQSLLAYAANKRWRTISAGISVDGFNINTDAQSISDMAQLKETLKSGALPDATFKGANGFTKVNTAKIAKFHAAAASHVNRNFEIEAEVSEAIKKGEIASYDDIDSRF